MNKSVRMVSILILSVVFLQACNPKPIVDGEENKLSANIHRIPEAERLLDSTPYFPDDYPFIQGIERLSDYMGVPLTDELVTKVYHNFEKYEVALTDLLHVLADAGLPLLYQTIDPIELENEIRVGRPVVVQFPFSGQNSGHGIFYGIDEENYYYYQLPSMRERTYPISQLQQKHANGDLLEVVVVAEKTDNLLATLQSSSLYLARWGQDVYRKKNPEAYREYIDTVEHLQWRIAPEDQNQIYAYYYIFYDPQPEKVEALILNSYKDKGFLPSSQELAFMLYVSLGKFDEAQKVASNIGVSPNQLSFYQDATLFHLGKLYLEQDNHQIAQNILRELQLRTPDYPGLKELLKEVED